MDLTFDGELGVRSFWTKKWRTRYFAVAHGALSWWESEDQAFANDGSADKPVGSVALGSLLSVVSVKESDDLDASWCDQLATPSARAAALLASSATPRSAPLVSASSARRLARQSTGLSPSTSAGDTLVTDSPRSEGSRGATNAPDAGPTSGLTPSSLQALAGFIADDYGSDSAHVIVVCHLVSTALHASAESGITSSGSGAGGAAAGAGAGLKEPLVLRLSDSSEVQLWLYVLRSLCASPRRPLPADVASAIAARNADKASRRQREGLLEFAVVLRPAADAPSTPVSPSFGAASAGSLPAVTPGANPHAISPRAAVEAERVSLSAASTAPAASTPPPLSWECGPEGPERVAMRAAVFSYLLKRTPGAAGGGPAGNGPDTPAAAAQTAYLRTVVVPGVEERMYARASGDRPAYLDTASFMARIKRAFAERAAAAAAAAAAGVDPPTAASDAAARDAEAAEKAGLHKAILDAAAAAGATAGAAAGAAAASDAASRKHMSAASRAKQRAAARGLTRRGTGISLPGVGSPGYRGPIQGALYEDDDDDEEAEDEAEDERVSVGGAGSALGSNSAPASPRDALAPSDSSPGMNAAGTDGASSSSPPAVSSSSSASGPAGALNFSVSSTAGLPPTSPSARDDAADGAADAESVSSAFVNGGAPTSPRQPLSQGQQGQQHSQQQQYNARSTVLAPRWGKHPHPWADAASPYHLPGHMVRHYPAQADGGVRVAMVLETRPREPPYLPALNKWQHRQCAECGASQTTGWFGVRALYCFYTELLYCAECMSESPRPLPWRIVQRLEDAAMPVSKSAAEYLDRVWTLPVIALSAVAPATLARVPALQRAMQLRARLADVLEAVTVNTATAADSGYGPGAAAALASSSRKGSASLSASSGGGGVGGGGAASVSSSSHRGGGSSVGGAGAFASPPPQHASASVSGLINSSSSMESPFSPIAYVAGNDTAAASELAAAAEAAAGTFASGCGSGALVSLVSPIVVSAEQGCGGCGLSEAARAHSSMPSEALSPTDAATGRSAAAAALRSDMVAAAQSHLGTSLAFMVDSVELLPLSLVVPLSATGSKGGAAAKMLTRLQSAVAACEDFAAAAGFGALIAPPPAQQQSRGSADESADGSAPRSKRGLGFGFGRRKATVAVTAEGAAAALAPKQLSATGAGPTVLRVTASTVVAGAAAPGSSGGGSKKPRDRSAAEVDAAAAAAVGDAAADAEGPPSPTLSDADGIAALPPISLDDSVSTTGPRRRTARGGAAAGNAGAASVAFTADGESEEEDEEEDDDDVGGRSSGDVLGGEEDGESVSGGVCVTPLMLEERSRTTATAAAGSGPNAYVGLATRSTPHPPPPRPAGASASSSTAAASQDVALGAEVRGGTAFARALSRALPPPPSAGSPPLQHALADGTAVAPSHRQHRVASSGSQGSAASSAAGAAAAGARGLGARGNTGRRY